MLGFIFFALANAISLDDYVRNYNVGYGACAWAFAPGITFEVYPDVFNITLDMNETDYLSGYGERIETDKEDWIMALMSRRLLIPSIAFDAIAGLENARRRKDLVNLFTEEMITHYALYHESILTESLLTGIYNLPSSTGNVVALPEDAGYIRMVDGDPHIRWENKCLAYLGKRLGKWVGLPPSAICMRIASPEKPYGWTLAYGKNWNDVVARSCEHFTAQERLQGVPCCASSSLRQKLLSILHRQFLGVSIWK